MKKLNRNAYWFFCLAVVSALAVYLALPHRSGQSQESIPEEPALQESSPGAVFTVTNSNSSGAGSLRDAINGANASAGTDTIQFQIGTGAVEINLDTALPVITGPVLIDGTTQPGYSGTPLITLRRNNAPENSTGLRINGGGSTIKALSVGNFSIGILLENVGGNVVTGSFIGICPQNPTANCGNTGSGIWIFNSPDNRIGGTTAAERNIISRNGVGSTSQTIAGVFISGAASTGNIVEGNYIGTTIDGTASADDTENNGSSNVYIESAVNNRIGGTVGTTPGGACTGACNLISGNNRLGGILINGTGAMNNTVVGNFIGTNAAGTARINNSIGVTIANAASNNTLGGTSGTARNLIANGVRLVAGASANTVQGNYIGTDTTGNTGIGFTNILAAVLIDGSLNNRIGTAVGTTLGGACTGGCNLISGSNLLGVAITGADSTGNRVDYNYVGLNAAGTAALRNVGPAISLRNNANNNIIGRPLQTNFREKKTVENAPEIIRCIQDDKTGDYIRFDDVTGEYEMKHCRSGVTRTGVGELRRVPGGIQLEDAGVTAWINLQTGAGSTSSVFLQQGLFLSIFDQNTANNNCGCPTEGMQAVVGTVSSITNNPNNNIHNFYSIGFDATGRVILGNTATDGNIFHVDGSSNIYSNIFIGTNGDDISPVNIINGTRNLLTNLNIISVNSGSLANLPIDLNHNHIPDPNDDKDPDGGANNTQNYPVDLKVLNEPDGRVRLTGRFNSTPNKRFLIKIYVTGITNSLQGPIRFSTDIGLSFEVMTDENGNRDINELFSREVSDTLKAAEKVTATATCITEAQNASENFATALVDVPGDTSEMSPPAAVPRPKFDFDEDGKTDIAVYRPGAAAPAQSFWYNLQNISDSFIAPKNSPQTQSFWYILQSSDNTFRFVQFGIGEDKPVAGDYQGDGVTDFAVFRPSNGIWYNTRINPANFNAVQWGISTDIPVPGDYDDDGAIDQSVFRNGVWFIRQSLTGELLAQQFGLASDKPAPADYNGDGRTDVAVFRPSNGTWFISVCPTCPLQAVQFGVGEDIPVPGDYDGDGQADIAVFRPSNGVWYVLGSTAGFFAAQFGLATDKVLNGDFDADGKNDLAVWRPSEGNWYILRSSDGGFIALHWGQNGDIPVPSFPNQ